MSINNDKNQINCEILAPAGSYQCMVAAFNAGADAVYLGGSMFGARAYADNFDQQQLIEAIDYAHLRGKKLYLTVNTLLKPDEINLNLTEYLLPLYEAGLDAVIVQDLGALRVIHNHFPDLHIHASTQMTVTGVNFARELKSLGVTRIVTARELSLQEIEAIYKETGLEIESFVHGALCYSYSGQCLLSSIIGGRSGNRGRCAQPCRLPYEVYNKSGKLNNDTDKYILSPKDMCTLEILPKIIKSGVYSLKIEGRMKKPQYVASVVSAYRKYVDIIHEKSSYKVQAHHIEELKDIYNRGGFTEGFYERQNGRDMMSLYKPNHYGVAVAQIMDINSSQIKIKSLKDINKSDVLEINLRDSTSKEIIIDSNLKKNQIINIRNTIKGLTSLNSLYEPFIYRTRNNILIDNITQEYTDGNIDSRIEINGRAVIEKGKPMVLEAEVFNIRAAAFGSIPEEAKKAPATCDTIKDKLEKTGNTDFKFSSLKVQVEDNLFVPVSSLNELRRNCLEILKEELLKKYRRKYNYSVKEESEKKSSQKSLGLKERNFDCIVSSQIQLDVVLKADFINIIGIELSRFSYSQVSELLRRIKAFGKSAYIALPYICRQVAIKEFENNRELFLSEAYDGLIVRNYEEYIYFAEQFMKSGIKKRFIFDPAIYMLNRQTYDYMNSLSQKYNTESVFSLAYEINSGEMRKLTNGNENLRIEIYGHIPVMTSAGCVKKTVSKCDNSNEADIYLKDRLNNKFPVVTNCRYCYNTIFNGLPLYLGNDLEAIEKMGINHFSIRFTVENRGDTEEIMKLIGNYAGGVNNLKLQKDFTRGHFKRGVQ